MSYVSGAHNSGSIYAYSRALAAGTDYTYYFEAQDANGAAATGAPSTPMDAPDVTQASGGSQTSVGCNYNLSGVPFCWLYDSNAYPDTSAFLASFQSSCQQGGGTSVTSCTTAGAVGKCTITTSYLGFYSTTQYYFYPPYTQSLALTVCSQYNGMSYPPYTYSAVFTPLP